MKDDQHYHHFHPSVDSYLSNRNNGFLESEEAASSAAEDEVLSTEVMASNRSSVQELPDSSNVGLLTALSSGSFLVHFVRCVSDVFALIVCILMIRHWLRVEIFGPSSALDAFLERRSFDPSFKPDCDSDKEDEDEEEVTVESVLDQSRESSNPPSAFTASFDDENNTDHDDELDSCSISSKNSWFQEHYPDWSFSQSEEDEESR